MHESEILDLILAWLKPRRISSNVEKIKFQNQFDK